MYIYVCHIHYVMFQQSCQSLKIIILCYCTFLIYYLVFLNENLLFSLKIVELGFIFFNMA